MPYHPRMEFDPPMNSSSYAYYLNFVDPTWQTLEKSSHPLQLRPKASMEMPVPMNFPLSLGGRENRYSAFIEEREISHPAWLLPYSISYPSYPRMKECGRFTDLISNYWIRSTMRNIRKRIIRCYQRTINNYYWFLCLFDGFPVRKDI